MNQQTLILDLDDTLIHCNKYFKESRKQFAIQMQQWFNYLTEEEILQKQLEIDLKSVEEHGLDSARYPETLVATYIHFCALFGRSMSNSEMNQVYQIGQNVFEIQVQPFPNMYEVLDELRKDGHQLYLFTGGDQTNQQRKIEQLGLDCYFEKRMFICVHKNKRVLRKILTKINADKKSTWMVGNSLKTDIRPAIELGINAIHIPSEIEWSYNIVDLEIEPSGVFAELPSLTHLPEYLREYSFYTPAI